MSSENDEKVKQPSCCERSSKRMANFRKSAWNKETRTCFGKTLPDWGKTFAVYLIFYAVLGCFFAICFKVFLKTLGNEAPLMINMLSPIKNNPALHFDPKVDKDSTFIHLINSSYNQIYVDQLQTIYETYSNESDEYNVSSLGKPCSPENYFGYMNNTPCVMLRINKVYGWEPSVGDLSTLTCSPRNNSVPCLTLDDFQNNHFFKTQRKSEYIPISCRGQNPGDDDNILGVNFFPPYGFPSEKYPFLNQPGFRSPPVMVQFNLVPGTTVMIWCKLWTGLIKHDLFDQQGSVRFEMMVDVNVTFNAMIWDTIVPLVSPNITASD